MRRHTVPCKDGSLTAIHWQADPDDHARFPDAPSTLVMMNGYDGYAEEIMGFAEYFPCRPFDIIAFDGPGQGQHGAGWHATRAPVGAPNRGGVGLFRR